MTKLNSFIRLDFLTVKPYLKTNFLLFIFFIAIFTTMDLFHGGIGFTLFIGIYFSLIFIGFPFSINEKSNMDAIYPMLTVNKEIVVLGRYIHTIAVGLGILFFAITPSFITKLINAPDMLWVYSELLLPTFIFTLLIILSNAILLPIYFKFGYNRAKLAVLLPVALVIGTIFSIENSIGIIIDTIFFTNITTTGIALTLITLLLAFIVYLSYKISLAFYNKREF